MTSFSEILSRWPDGAALGRDLGVPYHTAAAWRRRGSLPVKYWHQLVKAATARNLDGVTIEALFEARALRLSHRAQPVAPAPPM